MFFKEIKQFKILNVSANIQFNIFLICIFFYLFTPYVLRFRFSLISGGEQNFF